MGKLKVVCAAVLYLLSPIDLAPEVVLGPFGLADDVLVLIAATRYVLRGD